MSPELPLSAFPVTIRAKPLVSPEAVSIKIEPEDFVLLAPDKSTKCPPSCETDAPAIILTEPPGAESA